MYSNFNSLENRQTASIHESLFLKDLLKVRARIFASKSNRKYGDELFECYNKFHEKELSLHFKENELPNQYVLFRLIKSFKFFLRYFNLKLY